MQAYQHSLTRQSRSCKEGMRRVRTHIPLPPWAVKVCLLDTGDSKEGSYKRCLQTVLKAHKMFSRTTQFSKSLPREQAPGPPLKSHASGARQFVH